MKDNRGYRRCVRTIIVKENKILLGQKYKNGLFLGYEFPGGGIEEGQTEEEAVKRECLEEVGILVDNIVFLGLELKYDVNYSDPERARKYRGGIDKLFAARFVRKNYSLHNTQGDKLPYTWETVENAIKKIEKTEDVGYHQFRINGLLKVKQLMKKKKSIFSW